MKLKILHTSDWHLGKKLFKHGRLYEQVLFLNWLSQFILSEGITHLVIAGDIFDSPYPPSDALTEYFHFLEKISKESSCQVIIISGNHDSGKFLEAPKNILKGKNIQIFGTLPDDLSSNIISIPHGDGVVQFFALPYFRHHELYNWSKQFTADPSKISDISSENLIELIFEHTKLKKNRSQKSLNILIAHHLFGSYEASGSEYALTLSGIDSIPLGLIKKHYDITLLGHIHKYQCLSNDEHFISYSGSPIPFRFSEKNNKFVNLIEINEDLSFTNTKMEIPNSRKLIPLSGTKEQVLKKIDSLSFPANNSLASYIEIVLDQTEPEFGLADLLRNLIEEKGHELISFIPRIRDTLQSEEDLPHKEVDSLNVVDLFKTFYKQKYQTENIPDQILNDFMEVLSESQSQNKKMENLDENP